MKYMFPIGRFSEIEVTFHAIRTLKATPPTYDDPGAPAEYEFEIESASEYRDQTPFKVDLPEWLEDQIITELQSDDNIYALLEDAQDD